MSYSLNRQAVQLGLRGDALARHANEWLLGVEGVSDFVTKQRANSKAPFDRLVTPQEDVYPVAEAEVAARLGLSGRAHGP